MSCTRWLFDGHDFDKWQSYERQYTFADKPEIRYNEVRQTRVCKRCGYRQDESVVQGKVPYMDKPSAVDAETQALRKMAGL